MQGGGAGFRSFHCELDDAEVLIVEVARGGQALNGQAAGDHRVSFHPGEIGGLPGDYGDAIGADFLADFVVGIQGTPGSYDRFWADAKIAGSAELRQEGKQIDEFIPANFFHEALGHQGNGGNDLFLDQIGENRDFRAVVVAKDEFFLGFANKDAGHDGAVITHDCCRVVTLLNFLARFQKRFDEVIGLRGGADAGEVGADEASRAADRVAFNALQIFLAIDDFATVGISE